MYVANMLLSNAVSHRLATSAASELAERERSGNRKFFTVYPASSGSSIWKARLRTRPTTAYEMHGALYLISLALCGHVTSISALIFLWQGGKLSSRYWLACLSHICYRAVRERELLHIPSILQGILLLWGRQRFYLRRLCLNDVGGSLECGKLQRWCQVLPNIFVGACDLIFEV